MVQLICRALGSESNAYLFFVDISRITMTNVFLYGNITTSRNSIQPTPFRLTKTPESKGGKK